MTKSLQVSTTPQDSAQRDRAGMAGYMEFFAELPIDRQEAHLSVWVRWLLNRLVAADGSAAAIELPEVQS